MIKIVYDIKVYREGLRDIVKEDDVVVELGCHVGNSTRIISQMAPYGRIISLDNTAFKVFFIWSSTLKPRETIIRNRGLLDFIHSSTSSEIINSNYGWLESCGDDGIPTRLKELKLWSPKL